MRWEESDDEACPNGVSDREYSNDCRRSISSVCCHSFCFFHSNQQVKVSADGFMQVKRALTLKYAYSLHFLDTHLAGLHAIDSGQRAGDQHLRLSLRLLLLQTCLLIWCPSSLMNPLLISYKQRPYKNTIPLSSFSCLFLVCFLLVALKRAHTLLVFTLTVGSTLVTDTSGSLLACCSSRPATLNLVPLNPS